MSFKPRNDQNKVDFHREIKPNMIPTNIEQNQQQQQVYFNTKGYYKDLELRIQNQRNQLNDLLEKSERLLDEELQRQQYMGII